MSNEWMNKDETFCKNMQAVRRQNPLHAEDENTLHASDAIYYRMPIQNIDYCWGKLPEHCDLKIQTDDAPTKIIVAVLK